MSMKNDSDMNSNRISLAKEKCETFDSFFFLTENHLFG